MTLVLAIVAGLWFWLARTEFGYQWVHPFKQPFVMALVFGIIMGDIPTAMIVGASLEMIYIGIISPGSNIPTDETLAGTVAIPIALLSGMDAQTAVTLAIPVGILGVILETVRKNVQIALVHRADKCAQVADIKGIERCATIYPLVIGFVLRFPPVFAAVFFGTDFIQKVLDVIPEFVSNGLSVAGGILPALGFAITINVIGKKSFIPFFIIGYFLIQYLGLNVMACSIFGICVALLITLMKRENAEEI
ncbi:PTS mannose/fructose/sorbose/N-acetylgalactosamine transporter subunit IIC [Faecalicatena orotica]|uniref:PTS mannose/fructose/sorbose/N-acetylgalactosamine transporter subunit IIC n=1 Tax=Faecalicatena orotica TaxID=1544 RepID=UPI003216F194